MQQNPKQYCKIPEVGTVPYTRDSQGTSNTWKTVSPELISKRLSTVLKLEWQVWNGITPYKMFCAIKIEREDKILSSKSLIKLNGCLFSTRMCPMHLCAVGIALKGTVIVTGKKPTWEVHSVWTGDCCLWSVASCLLTSGKIFLILSSNAVLWSAIQKQDSLYGSSCFGV